MAALFMALKALGPTFLGIIMPLLTDRMFKAGVYRIAKYYADRYESRAKRTQDPEDDLKAVALQRFLREVQVAWKIEF